VAFGFESSSSCARLTGDADFQSARQPWLAQEPTGFSRWWLSSDFEIKTADGWQIFGHLYIRGPLTAFDGLTNSFIDCQ